LRLLTENIVLPTTRRFRGKYARRGSTWYWSIRGWSSQYV